MSFSDKKRQLTEPKKTSYRWQNIINLPDNIQMYDLSTGKRYTVGQFKPIHISEYGDRVEEFAIKGTDNRVFVSFLRKVGDKNVCSIGGLVR